MVGWLCFKSSDLNQQLNRDLSQMIFFNIQNFGQFHSFSFVFVVLIC